MHRSLVLLALVLLTAGLFASRGPTQNLIENGSFENGLTDWKANAAARVIFAGSSATDGSYVLELEMQSSASIGFVIQNLDLEPDREYELSFDHQRSFSATGFRLPVTLGAFTPYHAIARPYFWWTNPDLVAPTPDDWKTETTRFFASDTASPIQVGPITYRYNPLFGGKVWVDNVRVTPLSTYRDTGVDHDYLPFVPSEATVGETVELSVSCVDVRPPEGNLTVRGTPVRRAATMNVSASDPGAAFPSVITFDGETDLELPITFQTPGVHRVTLSHPNGHTVTSNPIRVTASDPVRRHYWGDLHFHTAYHHAGWIGGDGFENYWFARDIASLDFAGLTEHFDTSTALTYIRQMSDATELYHDPGRFVTFFASEGNGTVQGHFNTYLRGSDRFEMADPRFQSFQSEASKLDFYRDQGTPAMVVPHHFALLEPNDWRVADRDGQPVVEIYSNHGSSEEAGNWWRHPDHAGPSYALSGGAKGHDYLAVLDRGYRVGVIGSSDDHNARPGFDGLACVVAPDLQREELWDAMQARSCYATSGARILLDFSINGAAMGGELFAAPGAALVADLAVNGTDDVTQIDVVSDGAVVKSLFPTGPDFADSAVDLGAFGGSATSFYVRVYQSDQHRAWSSPIWVNPGGTPDLAVERGGLEFDHDTGELVVNARNFGDAPANTAVRLFSSAGHPAIEDFELQGQDLGVVVRVEPQSHDRALLRVYLYIPKSFNSVFDFSGQIELTGEDGYSVVTDPRNMLVDDGLGTLSWDEGPYGYKFSAGQCHSGQITDFTILVRTNAATTATCTFAIDGQPIADCYLGSVASAVPGRIDVAIGAVAGASEVTELPVTVPAGATTAVRFPGLAPGLSYVAVLDPTDAVAESDERNQSAAIAVSALAPTDTKWPDVPNPPPPPALTVRPLTAGMPLQNELQLTGVALYPDGTDTDATHVVTWMPDPEFDPFVTLLPDGRLQSSFWEASARVHASLALSGQTVRSDGALIWATDAVEPSILTAGYELTYLDEGNPSLPLVVTARVAQRDNFVDGSARVEMLNTDGGFWTPYLTSVELKDDGLAGDLEAGDGIFTKLFLPGVQSDANDFELGDNLKAIRVEYLADGATHESNAPWPYFLRGTDAWLPYPSASAPTPSDEDEANWGPKIKSAGTRGFGIIANWAYFEVEIAPPAHPAFAGAPLSVYANVPWQPAPVLLVPSAQGPNFFYLLSYVPPGVSDGLHLVDVQAASYLYWDSGTKIYDWWQSDWWPRLRLHDYLLDE